MRDIKILLFFSLKPQLPLTKGKKEQKIRCLDTILYHYLRQKNTGATASWIKIQDGMSYEAEQ